MLRLSHIPVLRTIVLIAFCFISLHECAAQWRQAGSLETSALQGKQVTAFAATSMDFYAATIGGVFLSRDGGIDWTEIDSGVTNKNVSSIVTNGTNIYAGTIGGGVFLSTNGGALWHSINLNGIDVRSLAVTNGALYAGTHGDGLNRSTNNGVTWEQMPANAVFDSLTINTLLLHDTTLYIGTSKGLYIFTTASNTLGQLGQGLITSANIYSLYLNDTLLYAGTPYAAYVSSNGGNNWQTLGSLPGIVDALYPQGNDLYVGVSSVGGYGGVFLSTDGGSSWNAIDSGLYDTDVRALYVKGTNLLCGTAFGGVFRSTNSGEFWNSAGYGATFSYSVAICNANIIAGTDKGIFVSNDNGTTWIEKVPLSNNGIFFAVSDTIVLAGQTNGAIFISMNSGNDWAGVYPGAGNHLTSLAIQDSVFFAGATGVSGTATKGGVLVTRNSGTDWGLTVAKSDTIINTLYNDGTTLYVGAHNGLFITSDEGSSWSKGNTGLTDSNITAITIKDGMIFVGTDSGGVFYSTDNGLNWSSASNGLRNKKILSLSQSSITGDVYAGTNGNGIFATSPASAPYTWTSLNSGLPDSVVYSIAMNNSKGFIALGSNGVWYRPLSEISLTAVHDGLDGSPVQFTLAQNYPNPFSSSSEIVFSVIDPALYGKQISLTVYDADGKTICDVYTGTADNEIHSIHFSGAALPAGNYFYAITCNGQTLKREMTIVR